jgi:hypothetical protein
MQVENIHTRKITASKSQIVELLKTLSSRQDKVWPYEKWPRMKFKNGLKVGAVGGHGPIAYDVQAYNPDQEIIFRFLAPKGFNGVHKFEIKELGNQEVEMKHTIDMSTSLEGSFKWVSFVRPLHDALIEDAFDKIESHVSGKQVETPWSNYVRILRYFLK